MTRSQQARDKRYDVAVIGAGPGGVRVARRCAERGARVALIEKEAIGGVCLNRGCIPSKSLLASAHAVFAAQHASALGVEIPQVRADWQRIQSQKDRTVKELRAGMQSGMDQSPVDMILGRATVKSPNDVRVETDRGTRRIITRRLVLATGAEPVELPGLPFNHTSVISSDQALSLTDVPPRLVIVGGGFIGCETACMYAAAGSLVTLVEAQSHLLPQYDPWVGRALAPHLEALGIMVMTDTEVTGIIQEENPPLITLADRRTLPAEKVLVAVGRRPACDPAIRRALALSSEGRPIHVDGTFQTSTPDVFALGDVIGTTFLAHGATAEAEIAAANLTGGSCGMFNYEWIPKVVYTFPEVVHVGRTLGQCRTRKTPVCVGQASFQDNGRARAQRDTAGHIHLIADARHRLLGVTMIGPGTSEMAALATALVRCAKPFNNLCIAHPTYTETLLDAWEDTCKQTAHVPEEGDLVGNNFL